jgi:hypothetical protein
MLSIAFLRGAPAVVAALRVRWTGYEVQADLWIEFRCLSDLITDE